MKNIYEYIRNIKYQILYINLVITKYLNNEIGYRGKKEHETFIIILIIEYKIDIKI